MLLIRFTTTKILTLKQEQLIKEKVGQLFHDQKTVIHIEDNQVMYLDGQELECMMIECQCYDMDNLNEFANKLMLEIENITDISQKHQYLTVKLLDFYISEGK